MKFPIQRDDVESPNSPASFVPPISLLRFVLQRGVLRLGLTLFVISTLYIYLVLGDHEIITRSRVQFTAPSCLLLGCLWGIRGWHNARRPKVPN